MKYLLDTMVWLWSVGPTDRIGQQGLEILSAGGEEIYFSAASMWEIAIKTQSGKIDLPEIPTRYVPKRLTEQGILSLPVTQTHALAVYDLPRHHSDPFDRMIVAQAQIEELTVLTSDRLLEKYPIDIVWCGK
jgi:PIN domain nuclease of toxin-antitoxin system